MRGLGVELFTDEVARDWLRMAQGRMAVVQAQWPGKSAARCSRARTRQDFREELTQPKCQKEVHRLTARASQDVRMDEPLADACFEDRSRLCDGVQPVRALGRLALQAAALTQEAGCGRTDAEGI